MNTDKIYAEHIANEYSVKRESKVIALKKLDRKAKLPADIFVYTNGIIMSLILGLGMNAYDKYNYLKDYILLPILERFNIPKEQRNYLIAFYINGIMSIIKQWLNTNCKDNIEDIEVVIMKCVGTYK